jgi:hypothetical protein
MNVYVDESGDLGWTLDRPYRRGGSSRYLTITFLLVPPELSHLPKRTVKKLYSKRKKSAKSELKGSELKLAEKIYFANEVIKVLERNPEIEVLAITVRKENVQAHIREDPNKLYNYMISLVLLEKIKNRPVVNFIPDARSIKVKSANTLVDYLQTKLWFEFNSSTIIRNYPQESHKVVNLQFVDCISHIIWSRYEDNETRGFDILRRKVRPVPLFF